MWKAVAAVWYLALLVWAVVNALNPDWIIYPVMEAIGQVIGK